MFDRSAGVTREAALELLSWKEEGGWATAKAPAVSRMASPFEISCNQGFTALPSSLSSRPRFAISVEFCHFNRVLSSKHPFVIPTEPAAGEWRDLLFLTSCTTSWLLTCLDLRRRGIRTHRQTSLLDELHRLRNGDVDRPALVHERLIRIQGLLLRIKERVHIGCIAGLQPRFRKDHDVFRRIVLQHGPRSRRGRRPLRAHHRIGLSLRKQDIALRHKAEHSPQNQLDKNP